MDSKDGRPPEIVIIRRGGPSHDESHHGGAWKIAYADFMTAMMALFLVMWLISASDEKTIAQVASYFNPVPLSDRTTADRGVQDRKDGGTGKEEAKQRPKTPLFGKKTSNEEGLFADPYNVLAKLAAQAVMVPPAGSGDAKATSGEAFRDPFDPEFRYNSTTEDRKDSEAKPKYDASTDVGGSGQQSTADASPGVKPVPPPAKQDSKPKTADLTPDKKAGKDTEAEKIALETKQVEADLKKAIAEAGLSKLPEITVEQTPEGVLISITDKLNFEMFAISSAEPRPELVVVMEKLAKALSAEPGSLVIRGHTDGRPFRSKTSDNWRLSTARAQIAYYMLMRGGLDQQRVERIEGHADRDLKVPADPNAAQNRRIEILLRPAKA